jgi:hypothetical protein
MLKLDHYSEFIHQTENARSAGVLFKTTTSGWSADMHCSRSAAYSGLEKLTKQLVALRFNFKAGHIPVGVYFSSWQWLELGGKVPPSHSSVVKQMIAGGWLAGNSIDYLTGEIGRKEFVTIASGGGRVIFISGYRLLAEGL